MMRSSANGINLRDQILRNNLEEGIPAQFVNEPADCRLYWTPEMIGDVSEVWKAAADAAWGGKECVAGGLPKSNEMGERDVLALEERSMVSVRMSEDVQQGKDSLWEARHGVKGPL
jgi:hypothetical protein